MVLLLTGPRLEIAAHSLRMLLLELLVRVRDRRVEHLYLVDLGVLLLIGQVLLR